MIDKYIYRRKKGTNIIIILILLSSFFNIAIPQWDGVGTDTITKTILNVQSAKKKEEKNNNDKFRFKQGTLKAKYMSMYQKYKEGNANFRFKEGKFPLGGIAGALMGMINPLKSRKGAKNWLPGARRDNSKHRYTHVPEHHCLAPGFCGCKGMGGQECLEAIRGCCNSFCEPLCVEDMIGCKISGSASRLKGAGGKALKDELCHVLVGAGCSNELPACSGKNVYVHYTDSANALGQIKKKAHTTQVSDLNFEDEVEPGCSVFVTLYVKKHNPYPCTGGFKPLPKLDDAPRHKKPFNYAGKFWLTQLPPMPSMCARFEKFKLMFLAALPALNIMATKRAMSCLGCSDDGGEACDFKNMFGVDLYKEAS